LRTFPARLFAETVFVPEDVNTEDPDVVLDLFFFVLLEEKDKADFAYVETPLVDATSDIPPPPTVFEI
jgi:hypothetical protein